MRSNGHGVTEEEPEPVFNRDHGVHRRHEQKRGVHKRGVLLAQTSAPNRLSLFLSKSHSVCKSVCQ